MLEKLLQDCVDELFALQEQTTKNLNQFIKDTATIIKASHKLANEAQEAALKAKGAVQQYEQSARHTLEQTVTYANEVSFWRRLGFWVGVGYVAFGALLALAVMLGGYRLAKRQAAIDALNLPPPIVLNTKNKSYVVIKRDSQRAVSLDDGNRVYVAEIAGGSTK